MLIDRFADNGGSVFFVISGTVRAVKNGVHLRTYEAGDFIGDLRYFDEALMPFDTIGASSGVLGGLPQAAIDQLACSRPVLALSLLRRIGNSAVCDVLSGSLSRRAAQLESGEEEVEEEEEEEVVVEEEGEEEEEEEEERETSWSRSRSRSRSRAAGLAGAPHSAPSCRQHRPCPGSPRRRPWGCPRHRCWRRPPPQRIRRHPSKWRFFTKARS